MQVSRIMLHAMLRFIPISSMRKVGHLVLQWLHHPLSSSSSWTEANCPASCTSLLTAFVPVLFDVGVPSYVRMIWKRVNSRQIVIRLIPIFRDRSEMALFQVLSKWPFGERIRGSIISHCVLVRINYCMRLLGSLISFI